jgi:tetratricopeptide (TPR) repeat protein
MPVQGGGLPMPVAGGALPVPKTGFGEIDLPSLQNDLPNPMAAQAHMPMPVSDDRLLPNRPGGPGGPPAMSFGELDLPLVGGQQGGGAHGGGGAVSFGELDLPADPSIATNSPFASGGGGGGPLPAAGGSAPGGMAFGEVDLGGGIGDGPVKGPPVATSAGTFAFEEASLDAGNKPQTANRPPRRERYDGGGGIGRVGKILAGVAVLVVGGGALLELTPVGAFGRNYLSDQLHSSEYGKNALAAADAARAKCAVDTYAACSAAADELVEARRKAPRNRPLSAYAAFFEYMVEARFGTDPAKIARAKTFTGDVPPQTPYLEAAKAAEGAATGEWDKSKDLLEAAGAKEPKDGIQSDLALLRGEGALAMRDPTAALAAFNESLKATPTARAQFGIARAHYLAKNLVKSRDAVDATLKLSPSHAGAHTLKALLLWELSRDDNAALKEVTPVLDEKARKTEGASEVSMALATKGWIMLARDRAGEARAAFDEAVKIDPRNVTALVGQGEVLYADSRYTEALTRFDEAVKKDGSSVPAIIGSAKAKIALERLADAKGQLADARKRFPKDMGIALWLAKAEEALGNRTVADQLYNSALDLADPTNPDAIQAYAAYASFLASQGKTAEAQAKLDQARAKLPDSAALQRAFGEVDVLQGHYDEAVGHFESALQKNPNDLGTRYRLGVTYRKMKKLDLAAQELDKVAAIDREYPGIALERGLIFEQSGDVQKALEQFQSAFQKAPNDVDLMLRVGAAYVAIGKVDEALPLLLKVHQQRPNSAEANHFIGRAYLKQGGLESAAAMRYLQRAVELDPNHAEYHLYVAWAANEAQPAQLGLARTHVDKALQLDKLLGDAYWQRGIVERKEGAVNDAIKDLKRALELKPGRNEAHATLAEAYEDKNDTAAAMGEWARAIQGDDKQPTWRWRYGKLLMDKGNTADAAKHLSFAVAQGKVMQPRPGWLSKAAFEAGEALRRTGQKHDSALAYCLYLELAQTTDPDRKDAVKGLKDDGETCEPK